MSYNFTSPDFLSSVTPPVTTFPCTLAGWFNSTSITQNQALISVGDDDGPSFISLEVSGGIAGDPVRARSGSGTASTTTGYTGSQWYHACGVFASATSRTAYIDGGSSGTNTTSDTPSGISSLQIGRVFFNNTAGQRFAGRIAETAIWNVALNIDEIRSLADGYRPSLIRPQNLVFYAPLIRDLIDVARGISLINGDNVPVAEHVRRIG